MFVSLEYVEGYIEGKVNHEKELEFQVIDFVMAPHQSWHSMHCYNRYHHRTWPLA